MLFDTIFESSENSIIAEEFRDPSMLEEVMIADEISRLPEEKIKEFCQEGGVGEQLVQEGKLRKKTLVRLSKQDDLTRRTKMGALLLAKEKKDPLYTLPIPNSALENNLKLEQNASAFAPERVGVPIN